MTAHSLGNTHRDLADRALKKTLAIGLCCSGLFHTAAIAGVNYLAANSIEDLEITAIERVELDPEPTPTPAVKPIVPKAKPITTPAPKVVKPVAIKPPAPVKIPTPKAISTPPPVVKIVKSKVTIKPLSVPVAKAVPPAPKQITQPAIPKTATPPPFPKQLFADPAPKAAPAKTPKLAKKSTSPAPVTDLASPLTPTAPPKQVAFDANAQSQPDSSNDDFIPSQPGSTSKLARSTAPAPTAANQTSLAAANKLPQNFGDAAPSQSNNSPTNDDFGTAPPGNNTRIGANPTSIPSASNQTSLAGTPGKSNNLGANFGGGNNNNSPENDEPIGSGTPGNSSRIARSNSGGKTDSSSNQTSLGNGSRQGRSLGGSLGGTSTGTSNSAGSGSDDVGAGSPGNIATGGRNEAKIQCLRNCDIKYPDNLEDADMGRDKILVKVTIDASGTVTNAQIARSSGNLKLDRVALDGVKQMQLTAMGKPLTFRAKISTLANN